MAQRLPAGDLPVAATRKPLALPPVARQRALASYVQGYVMILCEYMAERESDLETLAKVEKPIGVTKFKKFSRSSSLM